MLLLLSFLVLVDASCLDRTPEYNPEYVSNPNYYYFDPRTHINSYEPQSNTSYIINLVIRLRCVGVHCIGIDDGSWACNDNNDSCYTVGFVIPTFSNIKELDGCDVNVSANYIMTYKPWNIALGNAFYGERVKIYGNVIVRTAFNAIYKNCFDTIPLYYPDELCLTNDTIDITLVFFIILGILIFCIIVSYLVYKIMEERNKQTYQSL